MSSDDDAYDFEEQLNFGLEWEKRVKPYIRRNLTAMVLQNIEFDEDPDRQLAGVDYESAAVDPEMDIKTYSHEHITNDDIVIEVASVLPHSPDGEKKRGWFYTSESDFVVVVGENKAGTDVYKRGWIMPLQTGVRAWFDDALESHDWDFALVPNGSYDTGIYWVPATDIPDEFLFSFDPRPPTDRETPQSELDKWTDRGGAGD